MSNPGIKARRPQTRPSGQPKSGWLRVLEQGANFLQDVTPLRDFDVYVVGFHCAKGEPDFQMEAHHFCRVVNEDLLQCVLFDGNTRDANLIGIEYIVSGRLFDDLPAQERPYWHPHNFEVLSGQLVAPGLPRAAETSLMHQLLNSYGKTWHTWHTNSTTSHPGMDLPYGDPKLMWSFNRDGECDEELLRDRERGMQIEVEPRRDARQRYVQEARPQFGVDDMRNDFPDSVPLAGVTDVREARGQE